MEVHQQTHYPKIGSKEDEINEVWKKKLFNYLKRFLAMPT